MQLRSIARTPHGASNTWDTEDAEVLVDYLFLFSALPLSKGGRAV